MQEERASLVRLAPLDLLAAAVGEARTRLRDDPCPFLATDVVVVDVRSGEHVPVGTGAALEGHGLTRPELAPYPERFVAEGLVDRPYCLYRYGPVAVVLDAGGLRGCPSRSALLMRLRTLRKA